MMIGQINARLVVARSGSLTIVLRNQFPHLWYKVARNAHDRFGGLNASFVLDERVLLGLLLVIGEYPSDFLFIPSCWEILFAHCCFFLRRLPHNALTVELARGVAAQYRFIQSGKL